MQDRGHEGTTQHDQRQGEKQPTVTLDHDAELGEVTANRTHHHATRDESSKRSSSWKKQQQRSEEFRHPAGITSPRLEAQFDENVDGLLGTGELEIKGLQENEGGNDATDPTCGAGWL